MTFSVDLDLSPFQAGPMQDATARRSAGEGRGKDFAGSLRGVAQSTDTPESLPPAGEDSAYFSLSNFPQTSPSPTSLLLSGTASTIGLPAVLTEGEAFEADMPALPTSGEMVGREKNIAEAANPSFLEPGAQSGQSANLNSEPLKMTVSGRAAEPSSPDLELAVAAPSHSGAQTHETEAASHSSLTAATPAAAAPPTEDATSLSSQTGLAVAAPHDFRAQAIETAEKTDTALPSANPAASVATPTGVLPMGAAATIPPNMATNTQFAASSAIAGLQPDSRTNPPAIAESAGLNRRSTPADAQPPTHADLTAEQVSSQPDAAVPDIAPVSSDAGQSADQGAGSAQTSSVLGGTIGGVPSQTAAFIQSPGNPAAPQLAPTHTALIATATQLPDIVARATANGQEDSIVVQLDPPELGRLSIDFKFDAQGLQHVTITAENPEAMRQLRQMHFELVQALERNGLSSQNMSFQHQNPQQNEGWGQQAKFGNTRFDSAALSGGDLIIAADSNPHRQIASGGRLDLKL